MARLTIPRLPLSALLFYVVALGLWKLGFIPNPTDIIGFLERLFSEYGLPVLFAAALMEGTAYLGLYVPGSFVIIMAVIFSNGRLSSLLAISGVVTIALTLSSSISYGIGRLLSFRDAPQPLEPTPKQILKNVLLACLHPNSLGFYFFNTGTKQLSPRQLLYVPPIMLVYGFVLASLFAQFKGPLREVIDTPYLVVTVLLAWFMVAMVGENSKSLSTDASAQSHPEHQ